MENIPDAGGRLERLNGVLEYDGHESDGNA
jgi:hypothetical protein